MTSDSLLAAQEVEAYLEAVDWLIALVDHEAVAHAWGQASAVARCSVGGVAAHAIDGGVVRMVQVLRDPEPSDARSVAVLDLFGPNRVADPNEDDLLFVILRAGAEDVAGQGQRALLEMGRTARTVLSTLLRVTPSHRAIPVVRIPGGAVPLQSYLRTRLLEVVVHGDDLVSRVTGLGAPYPPSAAVEVCLELCVELARAQLGDLAALRAFTRAGRAAPDALRVL
jgi:hypothetical protein